MGYKSVIRSMNAASNRAAREQDRLERARHREYERRLKKAQKIQEKQDAISAELKKTFAVGKIDKSQYNLLKLREKDIDLASLAVGGTPFVALAKRYITGKIEKQEFDTLSNDILPSDFVQERHIIENDIEEKQKAYKAFVAACSHCAGCAYCGKSGFFKFICEHKGKNLCFIHRRELKKLCTYSHHGYYFTVEPQDITETTPISINFNISCIM